MPYKINCSHFNQTINLTFSNSVDELLDPTGLILIIEKSFGFDSIPKAVEIKVFSGFFGNFDISVFKVFAECFVESVKPIDDLDDLSSLFENAVNASFLGRGILKL